jgi:transcriptional regulator with XRE-family HTH domain
MSRGGDLIKEARRRQGLSQSQLADRVGVPQSTIARWESGRNAPTLDRVFEVIRATGLDLETAIVPRDHSDMWQARELLALSPEGRSDELAHTVRTFDQMRSGVRVPA